MMRFSGTCGEILTLGKIIPEEMNDGEKEWLMQQGATDLEGLRAEARSQRYAVKRAERLMQHNMKLAEQKWHFADWWEVKTRPTCKACMRQGSTTRPDVFPYVGVPEG